MEREDREQRAVSPTQPARRVVSYSSEAEAATVLERLTTAGISARQVSIVSTDLRNRPAAGGRGRVVVGLALGAAAGAIVGLAVGVLLGALLDIAEAASLWLLLGCGVAGTMLGVLAVAIRRRSRRRRVARRRPDAERHEIWVGRAAYDDARQVVESWRPNHVGAGGST